MGAPAFTPASLFASGEIGVWYQPDDFSTLFQDTAGTTPVTAVEQPVGLMLDKSQGLVINSSSELVSNGGFDSTTTGWSAQNNATLSVSSGQLSVVGDGTPNPTAYQAITTVAGRWYKATVYHAHNGIFNSSLRLGTTIGGTELGDVLMTSTGNWSVLFKATGTTTYFALRNQTSTTTAGIFDNASLVEFAAGNHARAANGSTARPVLRNRYNLLTYSEQFDVGAAWTKSNVTVTANATTAPDGTTTADLITEDGTTSEHFASPTFSFSASTQYILSVYAKSNTRDYLYLRLGNTPFGGASQAVFDLTDGSVTLSGNIDSASAASVGNGWYRCQITATTTSSGSGPTKIGISNDGTSISYAGDGTSGIYIWGAQLTTAADDAAINGEYQRIAAAPTVGSAPTYDDDVTKFPPYLYATTDDAMSTASIDFSGGDEMSVFAGVTKLQDAATAVLAELSATVDSNNGGFLLRAPSLNGGNSYRFDSKGTAVAAAGTGAFAAAPDTSVVSGLADISDDVVTLRRNGSLVETSATDQGTGNYGNQSLYLFARNTANLFYTGRLYSLIVRNALTSGDELDNVEAYVAQKTGVTL